MGAKSHMDPQGFSADLNEYLKKVLSDNGKVDRSGRWLEEVTAGARSYDYWSKIVKDTRAMTTNDIQVLADAFGISAFDWVTYTQMHAAGEETPTLVFNVGGHEEDVNVLTAEEELELRQSDVDLAAYRGRNEAEHPRPE
ncbi:hypothetical protein [Microbacterium sp. NPDC087592]|uniref:hypothetical protein n=1 Tax=Microbacterium sp. NPDC087592 TaxID=3364193 RepID=UPI00380D923C